MKALWIALIIIGTLYGPLELTRVILNWEGFTGKHVLEIGFMWLFYIGAMILVSVLVAKQHSKGER